LEGVPLDLNYQLETANRRTVYRVNIANGQFDYFYLGPFTPGEYISALRFALCVAVNAVSLPLNTFRIAAFRAPQPSGFQAFEAAGRSLVGPVAQGVLVLPPTFVYLDFFGGGSVNPALWHIDIPLAHVVTPQERWIGVELENDSNGADLNGLIMPIVGHSDQFDLEE
jgi:hypothetical protein